MRKVTYIIPLNKFDESVEALLPNALKSIKDGKVKEHSVILVGPEDVLSKTENIVSELKMKTSVKNVVNSGETDFCSQVNKTRQCGTRRIPMHRYFSLSRNSLITANGYPSET